MAANNNNQYESFAETLRRSSAQSAHTAQALRLDAKRQKQQAQEALRRAALLEKLTDAINQLHDYVEADIYELIDLAVKSMTASDQAKVLAYLKTCVSKNLLDVIKPIEEASNNLDDSRTPFDGLCPENILINAFSSYELRPKLENLFEKHDLLTTVKYKLKHERPEQAVTFCNNNLELLKTGIVKKGFDYICSLITEACKSLLGLFKSQQPPMVTSLAFKASSPALFTFVQRQSAAEQIIKISRSLATPAC